MESDNYIDRLNVDLKLQSAYKPYEAQEAADSIVDKHILPTVESVLEDMGRDIDVSIPKIEINVGFVRLQDLSDVIESILRSALERQMSSSAVSSAEALREFAGTGEAPWGKRDRPFSPPLFLRDVLEEDADTVMAQISRFSEKELVGLLMAVPPSFSRQWDGKGSAILDSILDRLMRISPETAAVITARQSFWRNYLNLSEASVSAAVSVTEEVGFKYVKIDLREIPEGVSVEVSDYIDTPGPEASEFIMTPGPPVEYYRKVAAAEAEITPPAVTETDAPGPEASELIMTPGPPVEYYRKVAAAEAEITPPAVMETDAPGPYAASGSFTSAPEPVYRYVEIDLREIPEGVSVEVSDYIDTPGPEASEFIMTPGPSGKYYRKFSVAEAELPPVTLSHSVSPVVLPAEDTGSALQNTSEVSRVAGTSSGTERPEYGLEKEMTFTYSGNEPAGLDADLLRGKQDVPPTREDAHTERSEALRQSVDVRRQKAETRQDRDGVQEQRAKAQQGQPGAESELEKVLQPLGEASALKTAVNVAFVDKKNSPRADLPVFRYVEVDRRDIPEEVSIAVSDYMDTPGPDAPEFIMTFGIPVRFFRKTRFPGTATLERADDGSAGTLPAGNVSIENDLVFENPAGEIHSEEAHSRLGPRPLVLEPETDIWEVREFESGWAVERIPVSDAGLVLLHPFLHLLMQNLGLTKDGRFVSALARVRAVHLLRDLTGSPEPHFSQNLILEKILCGLPLGYALPPEWEPEDNEKEETEALLKAVCGHWRSLIGSSVKALCDGFILRPGTVERFEETWIIKVEGRTIDILMEDLPWELSMILLPWLDHPISVEWQHE